MRRKEQNCAQKLPFLTSTATPEPALGGSYCGSTRPFSTRARPLPAADLPLWSARKPCGLARWHQLLWFLHQRAEWPSQGPCIGEFKKLQPRMYNCNASRNSGRSWYTSRHGMEYASFIIRNDTRTMEVSKWMNRSEKSSTT